MSLIDRAVVAQDCPSIQNLDKLVPIGRSQVGDPEEVGVAHPVPVDGRALDQHDRLDYVGYFLGDPIGRATTENDVERFGESIGVGFDWER